MTELFEGGISRRRDRARLLPAGTLLAAGLSGLLAAGQSAFAAQDGYVLCKSATTDEVYQAEDGDCEYRYGTINGMDFATADSLKVGNVELSGPGGVSTFGSVKVNSTVETTILDAHSGEFSTELKALSGASVNMGGNRIQNVDAPTDDSDAATKKYVDDLMGSGSAKDAEQDTRIEEVDTDSRSRDTALGNRITGVDNDSKARDTAQDGRMTNIEAYNTTQDGLIATNAGNIAANTQNIAALDSRVGGLELGLADLGHEVSANRREARGGTALALSAASLRYDDRPGKLSVAGGVGHFKGMTGLSFGVGYAVDTSFRLNAAVSGVPQNHDVGVSAGLSWTLN